MGENNVLSNRREKSEHKGKKNQHKESRKQKTLQSKARIYDVEMNIQ